MAKSMIGLDPLAWLSPKETKAKKKTASKKKASKKKTSAKKTAASKKSTAKKAAMKKTATKKTAIKKKVVNKKTVAKKTVEKKTAQYVSPLGLDVERLESSFELLEPQAEKVVEIFYQQLFSNYPGVIPLFKNTSPDIQQKKLLASLKLVVANLRKPDILADALKNLGSKHQGYGAKPEHYEVVASTLISAMKEIAGDLWTEQIQSAWEQALRTIAEVMLGGYVDKGETETIEQNGTETEPESEEKAVSETVTLSNVQDISMVTELHKQVGELINAQDVVFDGSAVERIDAASLQLIACAFKQAEKYDNKVTWQGKSEALIKSAGLLGLTEALNLHD